MGGGVNGNDYELSRPLCIQYVHIVYNTSDFVARCASYLGQSRPITDYKCP